MVQVIIVKKLIPKCRPSTFVETKSRDKNDEVLILLRVLDNGYWKLSCETNPILKMILRCIGWKATTTSKPNDIQNPHRGHFENDCSLCCVAHNLSHG